MFKILTVEELADDAFAKTERVKMLGLMNTPTDYEERRKAFIELATARKEANDATARMLSVIEGKQETPTLPSFPNWDPFGPVAGRT